jgi:dihydroxyacid dehydratase/phosphogluconate dehydratase
LRAGNITKDDWVDLERAMTRSAGTCNTIGTASTMTSIADAMGMTLPGASSIPATDSGHPRMASSCGVRIVDMVWEDLKPSKILTRDSFMNGLVAYMTLGGSTNAAVDMIAMAKRAGVDLTLDDMSAMAAKVPVVTNVFPSGEYLMEDFYFAGGSRHFSTKCPVIWRWIAPPSMAIPLATTSRMRLAGMMM